jgi:hypothetical protein
VSREAQGERRGGSKKGLQAGEHSYDSPGNGIECSLPFPFLDPGRAVRSGVLAIDESDESLRPTFGGLRFCSPVAGEPGRDMFARAAGVVDADDGPWSPDPAASVKRNSTHSRENDCLEGVSVG